MDEEQNDAGDWITYDNMILAAEDGTEYQKEPLNITIDQAL